MDVLVQILDEGLKTLLATLKFCPTCMYELVTVFALDRIVMMECKRHDVVFVIFPTIHGYEIKVVPHNG